MSPPERFTRRRLLSLLRGEAQKPEPRSAPPPPAAVRAMPADGFSLEAFYSARAAAPGVTSAPPRVHLRPGLEFTPPKSPEQP
jgi:hypothetical protein